MALSCAGIVFSMFACLLDLCGTMNRCLKIVKDYSVGNVFSGKTFYLFKRVYSFEVSHVQGM